MAEKRIFSHIFPAQLAIIVISILVVVLFFSKIMRESYLNSASNKLQSMAVALRPLLASSLGQLRNNRQLSVKLQRIAQQAHIRITVIRADGKVIIESTQDPEKLENHAGRPEIRSALHGVPEQSIRFSATLAKETLYYAVPLKNKRGEIVAVLRTAMTLNSLERGLFFYYVDLVLIAGIVTTVAIGAAFFISRKLSKPLEKLRVSAAEIAAGNFSACPADSNIMEIDALAASISYMSDSLKTRINKAIERKKELNLILECLKEGVIAVNNDEHIITINRSALRILDLRLPDDISKGRVAQSGLTFKGLIRIEELHEFVDAVKSSEAPVQRRIETEIKAPVVLDVHGVRLKHNAGESLGVLLVISDITAIAQLETMRRNFAANVSHELKTPLTAIRGAVETLIDGAIDDKENAGRFLEIIRKHSERLTSLINDTMSLSRIESETEQNAVIREEFRVAELFANVIEVCREKAEKNAVIIKTVCSEDLTIKANMMMLEQAVANLLDNAVKFTAPGGSVLLQALKNRQGEVKLAVTDNGPGIPPEHIPKLFERFYRVDKGRSRKDGGTGLGLAIVKHIAQANGGYVAVTSSPGIETTFTITIPVEKYASNTIF